MVASSCSDALRVLLKNSINSTIDILRSIPKHIIAISPARCTQSPLRVSAVSLFLVFVRYYAVYLCRFGGALYTAGVALLAIIEATRNAFYDSFVPAK